MTTHTDGAGNSLCTAQGLVYKCFVRPYGQSGPGLVLSLIASCYYNCAPGTPNFIPVEGDPSKYKLLDAIPPPDFPQIVTYYAPSYCSHHPSGLECTHVWIQDAYGEHLIRVERFGE